MRLSDKTLIQRQFDVTNDTFSEFDKKEFESLIRWRGYNVVFEKAYLCPCKGKDTSHLLECKNCGGVGYIFCNPTKTKFIVTGVSSDDKLREASFREWGLIDSGVVNVTAINDDKFSYMDRVTLTDATAEHNQILYPALNDDETQVFTYTQYNIKSIEAIFLYNQVDESLTKIPSDEYSFSGNVIKFTTASDVDENSTISIRYVHYPVFHIIDIVRESMTSYKATGTADSKKLILPIKAIAKRAHLIKDVENYDGSKLFDNSWLPDECEPEDLSVFQRQLRYTDVMTVYDMLTQVQKDELAANLNPEYMYHDYTPLVTGLAAGYTVDVARYAAIDKTRIVHISISGTSNLSTFTITAPEASAGSIYFASARVINNGNPAISYVSIENSNIITVHRDSVGNAFQTFGEKSAEFTLIYEVP